MFHYPLQAYIFTVLPLHYKRNFKMTWSAQESIAKGDTIKSHNNNDRLTAFDPGQPG